jgi:hypothetical protein
LSLTVTSEGGLTMADAEEAIARTQLAGKDGVAGHQKTSASNLNDRLVTSLFVLAFIGLVVVWASAKSPYLTWGSFVAAILGVILFGVLRVRRIERVREERKRQVQQMQTGSNN